MGGARGRGQGVGAVGHRAQSSGRKISSEALIQVQQGDWNEHCCITYLTVGNRADLKSYHPQKRYLWEGMGC